MTAVTTKVLYVTITLRSRLQDKFLLEMLDLHNAHKQRNREF